MRHDAGIALGQVDDERWKRLAGRPVFFGHQSVGRDMLAGIRAVLEENPRLSLRVANTAETGKIAGPGFYEADLGQNRLPVTKAEAFANLLREGLGSMPDALAMYKYCYVDIQGHTDPDGLFRDYVARMDDLAAEFPRLTLVHFTIPLKVHVDNKVQRIKTGLKFRTELGMNLKRSRYNELMRARYANTNLLFDLAHLQALREDGSKVYTQVGARRVEMLNTEWTSDGGHLNDPGRKWIAERYLVFLAQLPFRVGSVN